MVCAQPAVRTPRPLPATATRVAVIAVAALALARLHLAWRPSTLCPLRALTGVPCPLCGGTTAAVRLGHADLPGALRASPLAVLGAVVVSTRSLGTPRLWGRLGPNARRLLLLCVFVASELWQLHRFALLP
ncbi:MAG TPA: DUF2752 domain-containing protein [Mycobacteriales bacterium]|nr:DUF2752 domain-containing protein [Mycobacteriales bacterium]